MDGILVLLALAILAIPVGVVLLFIGQSRLTSRVALLERQISDLRWAAPPAAALAAPQTAAATGAPVGDAPSGPDAVAATPPPAEASPGHWAPGTVTPEPAPRLPEAEALPLAGPIVLRRDRFADLGTWLLRNWVLVVSASSLALAGVFLVQYSVQNGLLPPQARVVAAYLFGLGLVAAGEWLRRRRGDGEGRDTAHIPSVFAGAGVVTLFAVTGAAQQMYGLIGPEAAFGLHLATAALAVVLGWYYGPFLVAFGLIGGAAAPFLVSTGAGPTAILYAYYALIAGTGLAVDAIRRWAWLSVLALVLAYAGGAAMMAGGAGDAGWLGFLLALPALAIALPRFSLVPDHPAPSTLATLWTRGAIGWPEFPVRLAAGAVLVSCLALYVFRGDGTLEGFLALGALTLLALALLIWAERAEGLADLALLPAAALILRIATEGLTGGTMLRAFLGQAINQRGPEVAAPMTLTGVVALATLISAGFAFRALKGGGLGLVHGLAAVLVAPVTVAVLDFAWSPTWVLAPMAWALHPLALAALLVALADRFARADGADHRRMAHATLSALSLIALALFTLTSATALTLALAALVLTAAWLDRRYDLREMGLFLQAAVAVLSWRLLLDPGVGWAMEAPVLSVVIAFGGTGAALAGAWSLLRGRERWVALAVLECAALAIAAVLADVLMTRALVPLAWRDNALDLAHVSTLIAMPWMVLALAQAWRARIDPILRRTRRIFAGGMGIGAGLGLAISAGPLNPLFFADAQDYGAQVTGPLLLDTLALAYALPALVLLAAAWKLPFSPRLRRILAAGGAGLAALYAGLEIRRFWRGDWLGVPGVSEAELYSYTVALMALGAGLLWQAIRRRSHPLRRIAMAVIALVIAKVFLIDAAGLTGLTRVFSFLGLGLSLAGLAWVNRWADRQLSKDA